MAIKKFHFGEFVDCNSVVIDLENCTSKLPYFTLDKGKLNYTLKPEDIVYGLGENVRGTNKRGWLYKSFCTDDPSHSSDKNSLYGAHNFFIVYGIEESFGVFIDTPAKVSYDIGYSEASTLTIEIAGNYDIYIIEDSDVNLIAKQFRKLIGRSYIAPKWAFGYQQSRWSYESSEKVEEIANKFIENEIPIDCIYLDIDYMERFKNFTTNNETFPDIDHLISKMKSLDIKLIPIIDAGCKIEKDYPIYEEGIKNNYFCNDIDGNPFVAAVWPGKVHFPDFFQKETREWFGMKYKFLTDKGIEGFWNDMNEPAIFYSENRLKEAIEFSKNCEGKNLDINSFFQLKDKFFNLSNSNEDYKSFYHKVDDKRLCHYDVHNLYGHFMTRAAKEGLDKIDENKRFLLFSRASSIGMHRYGGIWTGDNNSLFEHLEMNVKMMVNLNLCGYLYTGADTGGFGGNCTSDLLIRWFQFSMFTPLFRNHAALGTRNQEPFAFDKESNAVLKSYINFRYRLIPYLYSEYMKCTLNNDSMFKPLSFEYKDAFSRRVEDQVLLGDSLMLAPIIKQNALGRYVYLPEDMLLIKCNGEGLLSFKVQEAGHAYIDVALDETIFFLRQDKVLILGDMAKNVSSMDTKKLTVISYVKNKANYNFYNDDGITKDYLQDKFTSLNIEINSDNSIDCIGDLNGMQLNFVIFDKNGTRNNKILSFKD